MARVLKPFHNPEG